MSNTPSSARKQFPVAIRCQKCGHNGQAIWEEAALPNPRGLAPEIVSLPDGFYHRMQKDHALAPEIVCATCGSILPD